MSEEGDHPSSQILERKLATILSADVAGFSRLMGEDEEQTLRIFRGHKKVFESLVPMHRGRIFNTAGDAILAEFGSAVEAVRCATDIQSALRTRNDQLPPSRQVRFRIGINLGDVMVQDQDLLGDGVNVAARLQTAAEPGGICISGSVHDQIRDKLSLSFQSLGEKNFKNIQQAVRTFSITEAEGGRTLPAPTLPTRTGGAAKWIGAGALLLVLAGGGYWAHLGSESHAAAPVSAVAPAAPAASPAPARASQSANRAHTEQPGKTANVASPTGESTVPPAAATPTGAPPAAASTDTGSGAATLASASAATAPPGPRRAQYAGVYDGPVCYGKTSSEPARCFRGQGTISRGQLTGEWMMPGQAGITMFLAGRVTVSGDVTIHMHSQRPDGTRLALIDLTGTLHDGTINASGGFKNGRPATLTWQVDAGAAK